MHWLARIKTLIAKRFLVIEFCHDCGRRQEIVWTASDELWQRVMNDGVQVVCPECFDRRATDMGLFIRWVPQTEIVERK